MRSALMSVLRTGLVAGRCIFVRHANMSNMFDNATESLHVAMPRTGVFETFFVRKHFETRETDQHPGSC